MNDFLHNEISTLVDAMNQWRRRALKAESELERINNPPRYFKPRQFVTLAPFGNRRSESFTPPEVSRLKPQMVYEDDL